ncbi:UDP-glucose 4-epimerase GalE [Mechercharimyces sp. CAU 1602]|uniref:UDP-glucose 4-epimerase GalE n=1 Tax=Mechercharimyces sp. CAU 1602 TaxID=2973933 RepID=UPI002161111B|nr:UDP-glucose 4-epimerase GalE [Mechercharimyces sp. CAU 1602]MCS1352304.1 UDP-glucose 4-epimerase GalE [Mechercharimyces sp. CAU 1602]
MPILICGGLGYIGSHATWALIEEHGEEVVVIDNLAQGHLAANIAGAHLYVGDLGDEQLLDTIFTTHDIEAVIHFAASSLVGESMIHPLQYYKNNVLATYTLLAAMQKHDVRKIVFSSTAAVYGEPASIPIVETTPPQPHNPYGETKWASERLLHWCDHAYGIKAVILRYFNVAGAHVSGKIGEDHEPESHLIPLILQVALGKRQEVTIFGDDHPTPDGTCIRDYIHVTDLVNAHSLALDKLRRDEESATYNLGNGQGYSVQEVIATARRITTHPLPIAKAARRSGDPAILVASSHKAEKELGWSPSHSSLENIIASAWRWHSQHPDGYK